MARRDSVRKLAAHVLAGMALLAVACDGQPEDVATAGGDITIIQIHALIGGTFTPTAETKSMVLTNAPIGQSACFLAGFDGRLRNSDTGLQQVFITDHSDGKYWVVGTSRESLEKTIHWVCVKGLSANEISTYYWTTSSRDPFAPVDMGPSNSEICFLNKIEGWFNGDGEQVRARVSGGRWLLDGTMGTAYPYYIGAGATCIKGASDTERSGEVSMTTPSGGGSLLRNLPFDAQAGTYHGDVCGLTRLGGKWGDGTRSTRQASVRTDTDSPTGPWRLVATSSSNQINIGARCVVGDAFDLEF